MHPHARAQASVSRAHAQAGLCWFLEHPHTRARRHRPLERMRTRARARGRASGPHHVLDLADAVEQEAVDADAQGRDAHVAGRRHQRAERRQKRVLLAAEQALVPRRVLEHRGHPRAALAHAQVLHVHKVKHRARGRDVGVAPRVPQRGAERARAPAAHRHEHVARVVVVDGLDKEVALVRGHGLQLPVLDERVGAGELDAPRHVGRAEQHALAGRQVVML